MPMLNFTAVQDVVLAKCSLHNQMSVDCEALQDNDKDGIRVSREETAVKKKSTQNINTKLLKHRCYKNSW